MAVSDNDLDDDTDTLTHTASATGGYLARATAQVSVTVQYTTAPGITLSEAALSMEEGSGGDYTVVLDDPPADVVTVTIASSDPEVTVNPDTLTFSTTNYGIDQTVTVTTTADDDAFHDASALAHTPTIRGIASPVTLLPVLLRELAPTDGSEPARTIITPPPAGASVTYGIDSQMVTATREAGVPDGVTVNTVETLTTDLTITLTVPSPDRAFRLHPGGRYHRGTSRRIPCRPAGWKSACPGAAAPRGCCTTGRAAGGWYRVRGRAATRSAAR